ncbi:MAG: hypothetical protein B6U95_09055 [Thermofilum sp. ex4484_82]|nr:MAG: hypothetical protein B6U95_09055 [Thermofilum sp. ex4484_82]OYT36036.1 MAG: hypothetical protein B6U96_09060 [Archaeoglobales archaeon ex4484_92]
METSKDEISSIVKIYEKFKDFFEIPCINCGETVFTLPYREGTLHRIRCPKCGKTTYIKIFSGGINVFSEKEKCKTCNGTGEIRCPECKGKKELKYIEYNDIKDTESFWSLIILLFLFVCVLIGGIFYPEAFLLEPFIGFFIILGLYHIFNTYGKISACKKCGGKGKILCTKCNGRGYR